MNHTPNYSLSQWEAEDKVLRTDFNADNAKIDAAIKALDTGKADKSTVTALSGRISSVAAEGVRLYVGTYTGDGQNSRSFDFSKTLGRPPKVMVVMTGTQNKIHTWPNPTSTTVTFSTGQTPYYIDNEDNRTYRYFALG